MSITKIKLMNECGKCDYKGNEGLWRVMGASTTVPMFIDEYFKVEQDKMDKELFDLVPINAGAIAKRTGFTEPEIESFIVNGYPVCPNCKSDQFFAIK